MVNIRFSRQAVRPSSIQTVARPAPQPSTTVCMIVSCSASRRLMLTRAAAARGWRTVTCADVGNAHAIAERLRIRLALVDLEPAGTPKGIRWLCEQLKANQQDILLAVCGHRDDHHEEQWARQTGAWVYLPGAHSREQLTGLLGEARDIVVRLAELKAEARNQCLT